LQLIFQTRTFTPAAPDKSITDGLVEHRTAADVKASISFLSSSGRSNKPGESIIWQSCEKA
jgi:hypothetical protein